MLRSSAPCSYDVHIACPLRTFINFYLNCIFSSWLIFWNVIRSDFSLFTIWLWSTYCSIECLSLLLSFLQIFSACAHYAKRILSSTFSRWRLHSEVFSFGRRMTLILFRLISFISFIIYSQIFFSWFDWHLRAVTSYDNDDCIKQ